MTKGSENTSISTKLKQVFFWLRPIEFLLIVAGIVFATITYYIERDDRRDRRLIAGWQLLAQKSPGSSGKDLALNFLYDKGELGNNQALFGIDLSFVRHGAPVYLQNLDLYDEETDFGAYAPHSSFAGAILQGADLRRMTLTHSCFYKAEFGQAKLARTDFSNANLIYARLNKADMTDAKLENANLSGAIMNTTTGLEQSQLDEAYYCEAFGKPSLPEGLSVPSRSDCKLSEGCKWSEVWPKPRTQ